MTALERPGAQTLVGKCMCDAVEYEVADEFVYAANCHCSLCRRATGSAFKAFAGIERDKLGSPRARTLSWSSATLRITTRAAGFAGRSSTPSFATELRPRRDGDARRRPDHSAARAHLRRFEGAVVHDHRRPSSVRWACRSRGTLTACRHDGRIATHETLYSGSTIPDPSPDMTLTVATWNINSVRLRIRQVGQFLDRYQPGHPLPAGDQVPGRPVPVQAVQAARLRAHPGQRPEGLSRRRHRLARAVRRDRQARLLRQGRRAPRLPSPSPTKATTSASTTSTSRPAATSRTRRST